VKGVILNLLSIQVLLYWIVAITWLKTDAAWFYPSPGGLASSIKIKTGINWTGNFFIIFLFTHYKILFLLILLFIYSMFYGQNKD